eukprot:403369344
MSESINTEPNLDQQAIQQAQEEQKTQSVVESQQIQQDSQISDQNAVAELQKTQTSTALQESNMGFKLHVIIRLDLGMTKGKICAQASHAVLGLYKDLMETNPVLFAQWASLDFPQQTYEAHSLQELESADQEAENLELESFVVYDAGRTQIAAGSGTVCAIGPCETEFIRHILEKHNILE